MRDSIGGIPVIVIITLFIVIALGYVAFNVNYTKAFRMKNKAIDLFQEYHGADNCNVAGSGCGERLQKYADSIGYNPGGHLDCNHFPGSKSILGLVCVTTKTDDYFTNSERETLNIVDDNQETFYHDVYAVINIDIPIIKNMLMSMDVFYVTGSTGPIKKIDFGY